MSSATPGMETLDSMPVIESTATLKKNLEEKTKAAAEETREDPRTNETYVFDFEWRNGHGRTYSGRFKNRILSIAEQQMVGALASDMAGGKPYESLDFMTREINHMCSWMAFSLSDKDRPLWAADLRKLTDVNLLQALYKEVAQHEAIFHGLGETPQSSQSSD